MVVVVVKVGVGVYLIVWLGWRWGAGGRSRSARRVRFTSSKISNLYEVRALVIFGSKGIGVGDGGGLGILRALRGRALDF